MYKKVDKKILPKYFNDVRDGIKEFELRKDEDGIEVGDLLHLSEWEKTSEYPDGHYTGRELYMTVRYVLRNCPEYGLMDGYCIIGL